MSEYWVSELTPGSGDPLSIPTTSITELHQANDRTVAKEYGQQSSWATLWSAFQYLFGFDVTVYQLWQSIRQRARDIAKRSDTFDWVVSALCSIFLVLTFVKATWDEYDLHRYFIGTDIIFGSLFLFEAAIRMLTRWQSKTLVCDVAVCVAIWMRVGAIKASEDLVLIVRVQQILNLVNLLRFFRVIKAIENGKFLSQVEALRVLNRSLKGSLPFLLAIMVMALIAGSVVSSVLMSLAPLAAEDSEECRVAVAKAFGGLREVSVFLSGSLGGFNNWGPDLAMVLVQNATRGKVASGVLLFAWMLAALMLRLVLVGLVVGTCCTWMSTQREEEEGQQYKEYVQKRVEFYTEVESRFQDAGLEGKSDLKLDQVLELFKDGTCLSKVAVQQIFREADTSGDMIVSADEFIFASYGANCTSDMISLFTLDHKQKRALERLKNVSITLRARLSLGISRLRVISNALEKVEAQARNLRLDVQDLFEKERILMDNRKKSMMPDAGHARQVAMEALLSVEEKSQQYFLSERLTELERRAQALPQSFDVQDDAVATELVADVVVRTVLEMLSSELVGMCHRATAAAAAENNVNV